MKTCFILEAKISGSHGATQELDSRFLWPPAPPRRSQHMTIYETTSPAPSPALLHFDEKLLSGVEYRPCEIYSVLLR